MSEESSLLIQEYYKNNQYNSIPTSFTVTTTQGNSLCGDTITIYLTIKENTIIQYNYSWEPAQITKAAAEFLREFFIAEKIEKILTRNAEWVRSEGFEVSHRRIRSSVSALLAVRNAIHMLIEDGMRDEYEDLLGE